MYNHDVGKTNEARDRHNIAEEIVIELFVERRVNRVRGTDEKERVAVRSGTHDRFGGDISASARPAFDDDGLAEPLRQPLTHQARNDVVAAPGWKADDPAHRPRRIVLRPCHA